MPNPPDDPRYEGKFKRVCCRKPKVKEPDQFYRPLLMSVEMSRVKTRSCCNQPTTVTNSYPPCPPCDGTSPRSMAYAFNLGCTGNNACGCCGSDQQGSLNNSRFPSNSNGNGGMSSPGSQRGNNRKGVQCVRLPGQGPCDPPCFSTMVFPRYAPFVPEPKCIPPMLESPCIMNGCSMAPVGGSGMIGAYTRSCFSCNTCNSNGGKMDVCNIPQMGANNRPCFPPRRVNSCGGGCG